MTKPENPYTVRLKREGLDFMKQLDFTLRELAWELGFSAGYEWSVQEKIDAIKQLTEGGKDESKNN